MSDQVFAETYRDSIEHWENPAVGMETSMLCDLVRDLKLAVRVQIFRDYERVLHEFDLGRPVLLVTERAPRRSAPDIVPAHATMLLLTMNESSFTLWYPRVGEEAEILQDIEKRWWDEWYAIGIVLERGKSPGTAADALSLSCESQPATHQVCEETDIISF